jgi:DHA1 family bicyclomycin/chloramphenicol resistance-like MFS transporter
VKIHGTVQIKIKHFIPLEINRKNLLCLRSFYFNLIALEKNKRLVLIIILGLLSAIGPFSIDMYLPGFPTIAKDLGTTVDAVSYSLASFFIGICFGQLICGPLLDRFGRKLPLIIGLVLYIIASLGCAASNSIELLIFFRFLQALGGCVGMVAPRAIVRDLFPVDENAKIFSLLILILGVSPILAPTTGSYLIAAFGWYSVFIVLGIVTLLILMCVIFWLPESRKADPTFSLKPKPILNSFITVMKNPQFYTYSFSGGIASAGLFAYLSGSPFVFMNLYGVTEQQYGWIFAVIAVGLISSSQLNSLLLRKYSSAELMKTILVLQTIIGLILIGGTALDILGLSGTIFFIFLFLSCQGFSFPNSAALSMAPFTKEAGSASALMGAIQMGLGAFAAAAVGFLNAKTALPMTAVMAGCTFVALVILILGKKKIDYECRSNDIKEQTVDMIEKY